LDPVPSALKVQICDFRDLPKEDLEQQLVETLTSCESPSLLWTAKRPRKRWFSGLTDYRPLVLASSQCFEQILWLPPNADPQVPDEWTQDCRNLLRDYPLLYEGGDLDTYISQVRDHIFRQEKEIFPELLGHLPDTERALRELGYEHRGLEKGVERMGGVLRAHECGELSSRDRERFDLDFYHLLEHNLERKVEGVYLAVGFLR
jgi:hypothetical protein